MYGRVFGNLPHGCDMGGRGTAAAAYDIDQTFVEHGLDFALHLHGRVFILSPFVGKAGIGMTGDVYGGSGPGHLPQPRQHVLGPETAVQSYRQRFGMGHRCDKSLYRLPGQRTARGIRHRHREQQFRRTLTLGA